MEGGSCRVRRSQEFHWTFDGQGAGGVSRRRGKGEEEKAYRGGNGNCSLIIDG